MEASVSGNESDVMALMALVALDVMALRNKQERGNYIIY